MAHAWFMHMSFSRAPRSSHTSAALLIDSHSQD